MNVGEIVLWENNGMFSNKARVKANAAKYFTPSHFFNDEQRESKLVLRQRIIFLLNNYCISQDSLPRECLSFLCLVEVFYIFDESGAALQQELRE